MLRSSPFNPSYWFSNTLSLVTSKGRLFALRMNGTRPSSRDTIVSLTWELYGGSCSSPANCFFKIALNIFELATVGCWGNGHSPAVIFGVATERFKNAPFYFEHQNLDCLVVIGAKHLDEQGNWHPHKGKQPAQATNEGAEQ